MSLEEPDETLYCTYTHLYSMTIAFGPVIIWDLIFGLRRDLFLRCVG